MLAGMLIASLLSVAQAEVEAGGPVAEAIATAVRARVASTARVGLCEVELRWIGLGSGVDCPEDAQVLVDTQRMGTGGVALEDGFPLFPSRCLFLALPLSQ